MDFNNIQLPRMVTNPPLPNAVYTMMAEQENHEEIVENLTNNYNKLLELTQLKEKELEEAKKEAKITKKYNFWMMIITIVSMFVAIAAWITPLIQGGLKQ